MLFLKYLWSCDDECQFILLMLQADVKLSYVEVSFKGDSCELVRGVCISCNLLALVTWLK